MLLAQHF